MEDNDYEWYVGQEEFDRKEVEAILESQRAMIYNDIVRTLHVHMMKETESTGGYMRNHTEAEKVILEIIKNPRKPVY